MIDASLSVSDLFSRTFALVRVQPGKVIFAAGLTSALAIVLDQQPNGGLLFMLPFLVSIYFQYDLTSGALQALGLLPGGYRTRRLGALLGLILLTQFAITLGILLLVVPGLILLVRWFLCVPVLVTEEAGVFESLQISWEESRGRFWPIFAVVAAIYGPAFLASFALGFFAIAFDQAAVASAVANIVTYVALVVGWHAAVAAYSMRRGGTEGLYEVFA